nr:PREDICTED: dual specificity protein phosphatase 22-A-like [Opisthocomus hoazin]
MGDGMSKVVQGLYLGNIRGECPSLLPLRDAVGPLGSRLAGVSRSTTVLVAYLMTVTELGWEGCLAATKAVRSYVSPNFGFQRQLQEYEATLLQEVGPAPASPCAGVSRAW